MLPSSGLRSRQKCMSQRYLTSAMGAGSGGRVGQGGAACVTSGVFSPWDPCMFGRSLAGAWPSLMSGLSPLPHSGLPQPGPVRVSQSGQEEAAGGECSDRPLMIAPALISNPPPLQLLPLPLTWCPFPGLRPALTLASLLFSISLGSSFHLPTPCL